MKVKSVEAFPVSIPLKNPFKIALGTMTHSPHAIVKLTLENDMVGWGEASTWHAVYGCDQHMLVWVIKNYLGSAIVGKEIFQIEHVIEKMDRVIPENSMAKAGVEIALCDAWAKCLKTPLHRLIGGALRDTLPVIEGVDIIDPKEASAKAVKYVEQGFQCIKVKIGLDPNEDIERVAEVRRAVGEKVLIRVDANQGYDRSSALKVCRAMERFSLQWIEQPLAHWDIEGLAKLAKVIGTPIALDESVCTVQDAYQVIKAGAADVINIKISKCGGILKSKKIAAIAESAGIPCFLGSCLETGIGTTAGLQFAASCSNLDPHIELVGSGYYIDDIIFNPPIPKAGHHSLPTINGIGVEVDEEKLKKYSQG